MNDNTAIRAAVARFEIKVDEYTTFAKVSTIDRTELISIIMKTSNDTIDCLHFLR